MHRDEHGKSDRRDGARGDGLVLKIAGGVFFGLLAFTALQRYQERVAVEAAMEQFEKAIADPDPMGIVAEARRGQVAETERQRPKPVPEGFRCAGEVLLMRENGGWTQVTPRHNQWYCPHGGTVDDCYQVTAKSVGCG